MWVSWVEELTLYTGGSGNVWKDTGQLGGGGGGGSVYAIPEVCG